MTESVQLAPGVNLMVRPVAEDGKELPDSFESLPEYVLSGDYGAVE